jgi:hypothetical protein
MSRRRLIYLVLGAFGVMLVGVNVYTFLPFVEAGRQLETFCDHLPVGISLESLRAQATAQGYEVSAGADGLVRVEDPASGGRRSCALQFGAAASAASR